MASSPNENAVSNQKAQRQNSFTVSNNFNNEDFYIESIPKIDGKNSYISQTRLDRMSHRKNKKEWLFYPEDDSKAIWDLFITFVLLASCLITPFNIAFGSLQDSFEWIVINYTIDFFFFFDILVIFNSAFYDSEFVVVDDRRRIASEYIKSWLIVDILSIVPFDLLLKSTDNYEDFARIARLGRMYRLIKMTRLLRILKIVKDRSKVMKYLNDFLKIGLGFERLFFFIILFIILGHIVSCVMVITA